MTKGHNQGKSNEENPDKKGQGQEGHLPDSKKDESPNKGRNSDPDPSDGRKGQNSIP